MNAAIACAVCSANEVRMAHSPSRQLVDKLWAFCRVLRNDGVHVVEYTDQLTYLLFLKMAHERETRKINPEKGIVPEDCSWQRLLDADGSQLEETYNHILQTLAKQKGVLGTIFRGAQSRFKDPAKLKQLIVDLIDKQNWSATGTDIKGDAYESLLQKGAEDMKSGAGQYFTPRALIAAMVDVMQVTAKDTLHDPAVGSGGFLLSAFEHAAQTANSPKETEHLQTSFASGTELGDGPARLASMNMILHGMVKPGADSPIYVGDSLTADSGQRYSMVLANPPFGTSSSNVFVTEEGKLGKNNLTILRSDFWVTTSNKQLNFIQHIKTILDLNGRAAVVLPDNVLFEAGAGETIRQRLLKEFDVHTLLRLPTGIFYAGGVKANVLFFDKKPASETPWTKEMWVYDFRTNKHFTQKTKSLKRGDLEEFVQAFSAGHRQDRFETDRFKKFTYEELAVREKTNWDIFWLKSDSVIDAADLPAPEVLAEEILESLQSAVEEIQAVLEALRPNMGDEEQ
jgi:type I restriction enzyme M protein